jgi:uncharacterized protein
VGETIGAGHIDRLAQLRDLIGAAGRYDTSATRLLCFSGAGFHDRAAAIATARPDVDLIDLRTVYA